MLRQRRDRVQVVALGVLAVLAAITFAVIAPVTFWLSVFVGALAFTFVCLSYIFYVGINGLLDWVNRGE